MRNLIYNSTEILMGGRRIGLPIGHAKEDFFFLVIEFYGKLLHQTITYPEHLDMPPENTPLFEN